MRVDIFFATNRFSISTESSDGYTLTPRGEYGVSCEELRELFAHHAAITLRTTDDEFDACYGAFAQQLTAVEAAGGVVSRSDGRLLMIYRNQRWDLPKGHWEVGESIEECAVREVEEETGVEVSALGDKICETLHSYFMHERWELKRTHWYRMESEDLKRLTPQTEEGIEDVRWLTTTEVAELTATSFPTIRRVIEVRHRGTSSGYVILNLIQDPFP